MLKKIKSLLWSSVIDNSNQKEEEFKFETEEVKNKILILLEEKWDSFRKAEHYIDEDTLTLTDNEYEEFIAFCKENWINVDITGFKKNKHILTRSIRTRDKSLTIILKELIIKKEKCTI